jgi:hypothetical protein
MPDFQQMLESGANLLSSRNSPRQTTNQNFMERRCSLTNVEFSIIQEPSYLSRAYNAIRCHNWDSTDLLIAVPFIIIGYLALRRTQRL